MREDDDMKWVAIGWMVVGVLVIGSGMVTGYLQHLEKMEQIKHGMQIESGK